MSDSNLTQDQLTAVDALIAYVAHRQNVSTNEVRGVIECRFGNKVTDIEGCNFKAVVNELADLAINERFFSDPSIAFADDDTLEFGDCHG